MRCRSMSAWFDRREQDDDLLPSVNHLADAGPNVVSAGGLDRNVLAV